MRNKYVCPLCNSSDNQLIEVINTDEIKDAYLRYLNVKADLKAKEIRYIVCSSCNLGFFDPMATGDEKFYEQLQKFDWYYMTDKPEYYLAKKYLPSAGKVLEVGSGKAAFAKVVGKDNYVGLEFNDEAISRAKSTGINLIKESIENHAISHAKQYAAVVSFQVLEHVSNPSAFIQGCVDSLQVGGHLILAVPNHDGICGLAQNSFLDLPPHHVSHWGEKTMQYIAAHYDLELVSIDTEGVSDFHLTWGAKAIYEAKLRETFGLKSKLIDTSFFAKAIAKVASILLRIISPDLSSLKGHTILACYKKK